MTELTKDEARNQVLSRWRALPENERQTEQHAQIFAAALAELLDFRTMANKRKLILSWLRRERAGQPPWAYIEPESGAERDAAE